MTIYNINIENLYEYEKNKPLISEINRQKEKIQTLRRSNNFLYYQLAKERLNRLTEKYDYSIPGDDLDRLNVQYSLFKSSYKGSQAVELFNLVKNLINHPAEFVDLLVLMKKRLCLLRPSSVESADEKCEICNMPL